MRSNKKEEKASKAPIWQRLTSCILTFVMLSQICMPATVQAVELISDVFIQSELNSASQFEWVNNDSYQYQKAYYVDDTSYVKVSSIASFHQRLLEHRKTALPSPQMIPIINSDITLIIPNYPLGKQIGDNYVQSRFIRSQIFNLLNRNLLNDSYANEPDQITALYDNAYDFSNRGIRFGEKITRSQVNEFGKNFIWPELRRVNNENVLVPVVHLTDATVDQLLVDGHQIEFGGEIASFNNIVVNAGTIFTRRGTFLQTAGNFTVNDGAAVVANGDLNLLVGGTLQNISGRLSATDNVNIIASQYQQKTVLHRFATRYEQGTRLGEIASVDAENGNISLRSYNDIVVQGGVINGNNISLSANGNIILASQAATYVNNTPVGGYDVNNSTVTHFSTKLTAKENIELMAAGLIQINASTLHADEGFISILANNGVYISNEFDQFQSQRHGKFGNVTETINEFSTIAIRSVLESGKSILISTEYGEVTLKATELTSEDGTNINATNGKVNMLLAKEQDHYYYNRVKEGFWKIKTETQTDKVETAVYNSIIGGVNVQATHGLSVELVKDESKTLQETLSELSQTESLAWMSELYNDPDFAENIETVYQELVEIHEYEKTSSLSPAAMAIIAIAVAVAMGPAGAGWLGSGSNAIGSFGFINGAAMQAGALTLTTSAATSLANGEGVDGAIKKITSSEGLKSLAISMVTAGVLSGISDNLDFFDMPAASNTANLSVEAAQQLANAQQTIQLLNQATNALVNSTVSAGISTVINGGDFGDFTDTFVQSLALKAVHAIGDSMVEDIGEAYKGDDINNAIRYIAHAGAGCIRGALSAKVTNSSNSNGYSCASGAGGAVVGEAVADVYKANALEDFLDDKKLEVEAFRAEGKFKTQQEVIDYYNSSEQKEAFNSRLDEIKATGVDLAKLSGGLAAFVAGGDVDLAADAGEAAAKNNAFFLIPLFIMTIKAVDIALTANDLWDIYRHFANGDEQAGKLALAQFLGESAAGRLIPGFKTADEMLGWMVKNDYLSKNALEQVKNIFTRNRDEVSDVSFPDNSGLPVKEVSAGSKGNWDKAINGELEPNTIYKLDNGHSYTTDVKGRVVGVGGDLNSSIKLDRNTYQQLCAGRSCEGVHDGGHLIATHLGGAGDKINLVPMTRKLNRSEYRAMEKRLGDELLAGKDVRISISVSYPKDSTRPSIIKVDTWIDGAPKGYNFRQ